MIYIRLLWTFFKIGAFTFGGGYAMLPLVESEVVAHGWMSEQDIINFIAVRGKHSWFICSQCGNLCR